VGLGGCWGAGVERTDRSGKENSVIESAVFQRSIGRGGGVGGLSYNIRLAHVQCRSKDWRARGRTPRLRIAGPARPALWVCCGVVVVLRVRFVWGVTRGKAGGGGCVPCLSFLCVCVCFGWGRGSLSLFRHQVSQPRRKVWPDPPRVLSMNSTLSAKRVAWGDNRKGNATGGGVNDLHNQGEEADKSMRHCMYIFVTFTPRCALLSGTHTRTQDRQAGRQARTVSMWRATKKKLTMSTTSCATR
jgi:hypothetical protein